MECFMLSLLCFCLWKKQNTHTVYHTTDQSDSEGRKETVTQTNVGSAVSFHLSKQIVFETPYAWNAKEVRETAENKYYPIETLRCLI